MKISILITISLLICGIASAQTPAQPAKPNNIIVCAPSRAGMLAQKPLWVIFTGDTVIYKGINITAGAIEPNDIQSIHVLKDTAATKPYGADARYGVIQVYLKKGAVLDTTFIKSN